MQMCQTPLHVAAGYNNTEIVKFLLNWQGTETVDLEARNMVLELPQFFTFDWDLYHTFSTRQA
jgi:hypothetical protein